jgi:hypothetical protein
LNSAAVKGKKLERAKHTKSRRKGEAIRKKKEKKTFAVCIVVYVV